MNEPYQVLLDVWEGNPDPDVPTLLANGVAGMIVRLNDMQGGHHMDAQFIKLWEIGKRFPTRAIYFVYNPWVDGTANFNWLAAHLPVDFNGRIFHDIEVKYLGYTPEAYAANVAQFKDLCKPRWAQTGYTCQGFLPVLSSWPADIDYWWAAYPNALNTGETITWAEFHKRVKTFMFAYNGAACPGGYSNVKMWQCSGGGVHLPGFGVEKFDLNVFPGTLDDLRKWMKADQPIPAPAPTNNARIKSLVYELSDLVKYLE